MPLDAEIADAFSLAGRTVVVTGAASGLGLEAARLFALAGARLVLADLDGAGLEACAARIGGAAVVQPTDVSQREAVEALADAATEATGRLDGWVNCAGISLWAGVLEAPQAAAERVVGVNLMGVYWACAAAGRAMQRLGGGGSIVNVSSTAGDSPVPGLSVYGMAKAGVNQLTRVCAKEFGAFGVRVNAVAPGWIDTPINAPSYSDASGTVDPVQRQTVLSQMAAMSPLGITGEPADVGFALLYLMSDASRFVTGQVLRVSGGV